MKTKFNSLEEVKEYLIEKKKVCLQATRDSFGFFTNYKDFKNRAEEYKEIFLKNYFAFLLCYDLEKEEMEKIKADFLEAYKELLNKAENKYIEIAREIINYVL